MLINCKECGKEISDQARTCPNCGAKIKKEKQNNTSTIAIICIIIIGLLPMLFFLISVSNNDYNKYAKEAIQILEDYKDMDITNDVASQRIKNLSDELSSISNKEGDSSRKMELKLLSSELNLISIKLEYNELSNTKVNEYITELKK